MERAQQQGPPPLACSNALRPLTAALCGESLHAEVCRANLYQWPATCSACTQIRKGSPPSDGTDFSLYQSFIALLLCVATEHSRV